MSYRPCLPFLLAIAVLPGMLSACSGTGPEDPPVQAIYGVPAESQLTPYPSNRYTVSDATSATGLRVHVGTDNTKDLLVTGYPSVFEQINLT